MTILVTGCDNRLRRDSSFRVHAQRIRTESGSDPQGGSHSLSNLKSAWPWEHAAVTLALAKAAVTIPRAGALPGGNVYEMKWDGFIHWTLQRGHLAE